MKARIITRILASAGSMTALVMILEAGRKWN
jgi:hypothetical protein